MYKNKKTALITGINGQDGAYLAQLLLNKGYKVIGGIKRSSHNSLWRLDELGITKEVELIGLDLTEFSNIIRVVEKYNVDEIYNLAAQSFVMASFEHPIHTSDVNALGSLRLLEAIRVINPKIKFYQASTSEMFGKVSSIPQNETTSFYPRSPYGVSKLYAHWITVNYRESYDIHASSGILFNHESPLRGEEFITRKITSQLARIHYGLEDCLVVGNLDSKRDWGYAKDYVEGMYLMLQQEQPDDYVLASGKTSTVREFIECAASVVGIELEWQNTGVDCIGINKKTGKKLLSVDEKFYRPAEVDLLLGDASKAKEKLGWYPKTSFEELVHMMVTEDLRRIRNAYGLNGA